MITSFVYDNFDIVQEKDVSSQIQAVYITGALDEPLQRIALSDATPRIDTYQSDHGGSILALKDMNGVTTVAYSYDEYGNVQASAADNNPFQFTGRENDDTGLYYYRARFYSPPLRRFVQSDPIG